MQETPAIPAGEAYQRERQSRFTRGEIQFGLTFCPIKLTFFACLCPLLFALVESSFPCTPCFGSFAYDSPDWLPGFRDSILSRSRFLFPLFPRLQLRFHRLSHDANVTGALKIRLALPRAARHDLRYQRWAFADNRYPSPQPVRFQVRVVLRVGDRALQRFANSEMRLSSRRTPSNVQPQPKPANPGTHA
jgi:hypothetical protein